MRKICSGLYALCKGGGELTQQIWPIICHQKAHTPQKMTSHSTMPGHGPVHRQEVRDQPLDVTRGKGDSDAVVRLQSHRITAVGQPLLSPPKSDGWPKKYLSSEL